MNSGKEREMTSSPSEIYYSIIEGNKNTDTEAPDAVLCIETQLLNDILCLIGAYRSNTEATKLQVIGGLEAAKYIAMESMFRFIEDDEE